MNVEELPKLPQSPARPVVTLRSRTRNGSAARASTPPIADHGQRTFLNKKISHLVRGHAHEHAAGSISELELKDLSLNFRTVAKWIQRRYDWHRTQHARPSMRLLVWNGRRAGGNWIQSHSSHSCRTEQELHHGPCQGRRATGALQELHGRSPKGQDCVSHRQNAELFRHHLDMDIFPGGMGGKQSSRGHAYLTVVPPWLGTGSDAKLEAQGPIAPSTLRSMSRWLPPLRTRRRGGPRHGELDHEQNDQLRLCRPRVPRKLVPGHQPRVGT